MTYLKDLCGCPEYYTHATDASDGRLDRPMVPYLKGLNNLPGIRTVQSCSGHVHDDGSMSSGHLWFRLAQRLHIGFERVSIPTLSGSPLIEEVCRLYKPEDCFAIVFMGVEHDCLEESMDLICNLLADLARPRVFRRFEIVEPLMIWN